MTTPPTDPELFSPEAAFRRSPPRPGGGDIWCVGATSVARLGQCGALLLATSTEDGPAYPRVRIVTPPDGPSAKDIHAAAVSTIVLHRADTTPEIIERLVSSRLSIHASSSLDVESVMALLGLLDGAPGAVIIADAARYQGGAVGSSDEQLWAAHLAALAMRACEEALNSDGYVLLDAGQSPPHQPASLALLTNAHKECGVLMGRPINDSRAGRLERAHEVDALADAGRFGEALAVVDTLDLAPSGRLLMRAGVFLKAGLHPEAVAALQEVRASEAAVSVAAALRFATFAEQARHAGLASYFLRDAFDRATMVEDIETVLRLASRLDDEMVVEAAAEKLATLFPASPVLQAYFHDEAVLRGDWSAAAALLANNLERQTAAQGYTELARLLQAGPPDYDEVAHAVIGQWPDFSTEAIRACMIDAQKRGRHFEAVRLLQARLSQPASAQEIRNLLAATRVLLLNDRSCSEDEVIAALSTTCEQAIDRLAEEPADAGCRALLGNLLSTAESGILGRFVLRLALVDRISAPSAAGLPEPDRSPSTPDEMKAFLQACEAWMKQDRLLMTGRSQCPSDLVPKSFHAGVLWDLVAAIPHQATKIDEPDGVEDFLRYVTMVAGFASHLTGPDRDLDIQALKLAATLLAQANHRQRARDLIEIVLRIAGTDPARVRAAWFAYGETHRVAGDLEEAAIAIAAGSSRAAPTTLSALWHETLDIIRLLRDRGERQAARAFIARARETLDALGLAETYGSRLETLRLQIEQRELLGAQPIEPQRLGKLLDEAVSNGRAVLELGDETGPAAAVLAQTLRLARLEALPLPDGADEVSERLLGALPPRAAQRLARFFAEPTLDDLSALARELEGARYGHNLVQDVGHLVMLARRYLYGDALPPEGAAFAVELLADHGLLQRDEYGAETPAKLPVNPAAVMEVAKAIATTGLGVTLAGLDEGGRLVRVDVVDGLVRQPVREPPEVFSRERLVAWRREYPHRYAYLDQLKRPDGRPADSFQLIRAFEASIDGVGLSSLPPLRVVVIADAGLADIPVNLLPINGVFAGEQRAMATAPSLHWLAAAALRRGRAHGPSYCWVPTVDAPQDSLLPRVAEDLAPTLAAAGIPLDEGGAMPPELRGAELAIIAAHGGLGTVEEKFFRRVADEANRVMAGDRLAEGVTDAKVAILFVCNSARLDMEPGGQATLGLARQLLDRGCSAVIGSPWPLRGDVPRRWLPAFLEAWGQDLPVADACSFANERVGGLPETRHAMHVYGDPLVRRR